MFAYPFLQLGLVRCSVTIDERNAESLELCRRLGFAREGLLRKAYPGADGVLMGMLATECTWISRSKEHADQDQV